MGILLELVPVTWKWMDFFYFSRVQDVSCKEEYFYYHSAALSNTQICIPLARLKNLGKNTWGSWKRQNECSPFHCGEYQCVVFHASTTGLSVPGPRAWWLTGNLHVSSGSLSPLVDKFLSTELLFPWAGPAGRRTCLQEYESSWGRGLAWAGPHPGLWIRWTGTPLLLCSCMKHSPRGPDSGMTQL